MLGNDAMIRDMRFLAQRPTYDHKHEYLVCFDDRAMRWSLLSDKEQRGFAERFFEREYRSFERFDLCLSDIRPGADAKVPDTSFHLFGKIMVAPRLQFDKDTAIFEFLMSTDIDENLVAEEGKYMPWHRVLVFGDLAYTCNDLFCENMIVDITGSIRSTWCMFDADEEKEICETQLLAQSITIRGGVSVWRRADCPA